MQLKLMVWRRIGDEWRIGLGGGHTLHKPLRCTMGSHICTDAMFDWNDLKYPLAVSRHGSTLAAARALEVNRSTVQRRLADLERCIGRPCRTPRVAAFFDLLVDEIETLRPIITC